MKVIWRNNKSVETGMKNVGSGVNPSDLIKKPSSHNSLTKMKGYNHRISNVTRERCLMELQPHSNIATGKTGNERGLVVSHAEGGNESHAPPLCRVCSRPEDLRSLDDCTALLERCFGVKVLDSTVKICKHCADLIAHTYKFKEMICAAFQNRSSNVSDNSDSIKEGDSFLSIAKPKADFRSGSEEKFLRRIAMKRKIAHQEKSACKKTIVACVVCHQRYPMMAKMDGFVCSRCKVKSNSDRTAACVKCKAIVHCSAMKEHLERHAKADLKGRCRLRSLTKQPSKAQTDCVSSDNKQGKLCCPRCQKRFNASSLLEKHLREAHATILMFVCQVCGKDMRSAEFLEKHLKMHVRTELFECQVCGRILKDKSVMEKHTAIHGERLKN